jgi:hypothetical protein
MRRRSRAIRTSAARRRCGAQRLPLRAWAVPTRTDGGGPAVMAPAHGSNERFVAEHEEMRRCMLHRGYELKAAG